MFEPAVGQGNRKLADGGLSSNLPAFLFAYEADISRVPIFAFDLGSSPRLNTGESGLHDFVAGLFSTALEAGDELLIGLIPRVHRVSVPVPEGINTLDFDIEDAAIQALYNAGLAATTEFLNDLPVMAYTKQAGDKLQQQLQANYGDPKLFQPALWGLAAMIEERTGAREVRSSVMLPTGRPNRSRIVTYHHAYRVDDTDSDLELDEFAGCSGHSLETRSPTVADLDEAKKDPSKWGMTTAQQAKVAPDRKSMLSVPIFAYSSDHQLDPDDWPILGVLSVDSSTPLSETGWVGSGIIEPVVGIPDRGAQAMTAMTAWADIISALIR